MDAGAASNHLPRSFEWSEKRRGGSQLLGFRQGFEKRSDARVCLKDKVSAASWGRDFSRSEKVVTESLSLYQHNYR